MKILFIYPDDGFTGRNRFHRGIAQLSACLKKDNFDVSLLHISDESIPPDSFIEKVKAERPDMLAYSSITTQYPAVKKFAALTGKLDIHTIYGGIHPTIAPDESIGTKGIDSICMGEGDEAIVDYAKAFENGGDINSIHNFWVKRDGKIYRNPVRPLVADLDMLPFPDFELFRYGRLDEYVYLKSAFVMCSRGCHFNCSYCCNHQLREIYPNKKKYLRFRGVENVIREIEDLRARYPGIAKIRFGDDTLAQDKEWFRELVEQYKKRVGLPFSTNDRVNNITEETVALYKEAGCFCVDMGIENGNDYIRNKLFDRHVSEERMISAFRLLEKNGIQTGSFNIIGAPGETMSTMLETVKLNAICRPTTCVNSYLFPFPGSKIRLICEEQGLEIMEFKKSQIERPSIRLQTATQDQLIFGFNYFRILLSVY
ncbi:MAG: radical SAM protein, partial [Deltaproteobacteria bacterium]|nr:radical SAM protein [Deltaproteobacteria bacterium]